MGIFGNSSSPMEIEIEKATSETNTSEKWSIIMDICDKIGSSSANAKESLKIIVRRLNHADPHVVMQAITLLDACVNNCGKNYHLEVASREFETEFRRLVSKSQPQIATKLKACLKKWAEGDFKSDPQLNLIPSLYSKLKQEGVDFAETQAPVKREVQFCKDPNVVASQQEADDIAKAIELSLKEKTTSPKALTYSSATTTTSLYPSVNSIANPTASSAATATATSSSIPASELRKVRALYDFEAAEDNELTFKAGEIIMVIEESDPNWWRGSNQRGEGYFPANFVTADLSMEPDDLTKETKSSKKNVQFDNSHETPKTEPAAVEINEEAIDRLLFLLHEADPSDPSQDSDEMLRLENAVNQMGPLIDSELERVDRKHAQLTQLSSDLIDTINLYHSLMQTDTASAMYGGGFASAQQMFRPPVAMFPGASNPNFPGMMPQQPGMGMNMAMQMPPASQMHGYPQMNNFPPPQQHQQPPMAPSGNFQMYQAPPQHPQSLPPQHQMMPSQQQHQQQMQQPMGMQMNPAMHPMNGPQHLPPQQQQQQQQTAPHDQQQAMYAMYPPQQQSSIPMPGGNMAM